MIANWRAGRVDDKDYWSYEDAKGCVLYRIHHLETKDARIKELAERNKLMRLVHSVVAEGATPTAFALIIKMPQLGAGVPWHRDLVSVPPNIIYNFSIYLDDSTQGNGCLEVVPGSHLFPDTFKVEDGRRPKDAHCVTARRGDIIIHDVRLVHGSAFSYSSCHRRSICIEFRPSLYGDLMEVDSELA
jgi:ectoine hydroxylase-related dioxygenase (phytanoyl-CoA dioxygenase family)